MFLGSKAAAGACKADNLTAICEPIVKNVVFWDVNMSLHYRSPRPVTGRAILNRQLIMSFCV
jgi:hypothetical protein